jgi:hypothetical protein
MSTGLLTSSGTLNSVCVDASPTEADINSAAFNPAGLVIAPDLNLVQRNEITQTRGALQPVERQIKLDEIVVVGVIPRVDSRRLCKSYASCARKAHGPMFAKPHLGRANPLRLLPEPARWQLGVRMLYDSGNPYPGDTFTLGGSEDQLLQRSKQFRAIVWIRSTLHLAEDRTPNGIEYTCGWALGYTPLRGPGATQLPWGHPSPRLGYGRVAEPYSPDTAIDGISWPVTFRVAFKLTNWLGEVMNAIVGYRAAWAWLRLTVAGKADGTLDVRVVSTYAPSLVLYRLGNLRLDN